MVLKSPCHPALVCIGLIQNVASDLVAVVLKGYWWKAACSPKPILLVGLQVVLLPPLYPWFDDSVVVDLLLPHVKELLILLLPLEGTLSVFCPSLLFSLCMVVLVWSFRLDGQRWLNSSFSQLANTRTDMSISFKESTPSIEKDLATSLIWKMGSSRMWSELSRPHKIKVEGKGI